MKNLILLTFMTIAFQSASLAQTSVIAHRGSWKQSNNPQNSIASFKEAIAQKTYGSEFDVHLTKDNILVLNHDHDYYGLDVEKSTYQELLAKKLPNGEPIPTAEEFIKEGLKQKGTKMVFELKTSRISKERTLEAVKQSIELVKKLKAQKMVEYIAFDWDACLKFRELDKKAKVFYLTGNKTPAEIKAAKLTGPDYHFTIFKKNPTWIKECKDLKLKTNVWTVNSEEDMKFFINEKVDFITTDETELLNKILNK